MSPIEFHRNSIELYMQSEMDYRNNCYVAMVESCNNLDAYIQHRRVILELAR